MVDIDDKVSRPTTDSNSELSLVSLVANNSNRTGNAIEAQPAPERRANDVTLPQLTIDAKVRSESNSNQRVPARISDERYPGPNLHAPELAGDRQTTLQQRDGIRAWGFESGAMLIQHTEGPLAGAQTLQDRHGRILRWQEPTAADGGTVRPRREVEFSYAPGDPAQNRNPQSVTIRNAETRELMRQPNGKPMITIADASTQITAGTEFYRVETTTNGAKQKIEVGNYNLNGTQFTETTVNSPRGQFRFNSMNFVPQQDITTVDGIQMPRGSVVTQSNAMDGSRSTTVQRRNGQLDNYSAANQNQRSFWDSSTFASPETRQYNVNGEQRDFSGIIAARRDRANGTLILDGQNFSWHLSFGQNGNVNNAEFVPNKKNK